MKTYTVYGQALAPVDVSIQVHADSKDAAFKEAQKMFEAQWGCGTITYSDDDLAVVDFTPLRAIEGENT